MPYSINIFLIFCHIGKLEYCRYCGRYIRVRNEIKEKVKLS